MNAIDTTTYATSLRSLLERVPDGHVLVVQENELVLVPETLARTTPHHLTPAQRRKVVRVGRVGLSEEG